MICSISGTTPQEPVVSVKSGHIYEKRLIKEYLETHDFKCPQTEQPMSLEDLIPVQVSKTVPPRPTTASSIPSLLYLFQNEWDALMLETYNLKKQLESVKQELSHTLYQHDAACRVIARLIKERDDARGALARFQIRKEGERPPSRDAPDAMEEEEKSEEAGLDPEIVAKMDAKAAELSKSRRERKLSETLATAEEIKEYSVLSSNNIHKPSSPGILSLDIHPKNQNLIVTGGVDGKVITFNRDAKKVVETIEAHSTSVTDVLFHPSLDLIFSTSSDHSAKVWKGQTESHTVSVHKAEVVGCTLHPTEDYWVTASLDQTWAFHDIATSTCVTQVTTDSSITAVQFHPDGLLLGTGTQDGLVKIWHVGSKKNAATFEGHKGKLVGLSFSENGFYLATVATDNVVKMWDLRKPVNFHSLEVEEEVSALSFDYSGSYLAVCAGNGVRVYVGKTLNHVTTLEKHSNKVTDAKWGDDASFLASTSLDRSLKVWGKKETRKRKA